MNTYVRTALIVVLISLLGWMYFTQPEEIISSEPVEKERFSPTETVIAPNPFRSREKAVTIENTAWSESEYANAPLEEGTFMDMLPVEGGGDKVKPLSYSDLLASIRHIEKTGDFSKFYQLLNLADHEVVTDALSVFVGYSLGLEKWQEMEVFQAIISHADIYRERTGVNALLRNVIENGTAEQIDYVLNLLPQEMLYAELYDGEQLITRSWKGGLSASFETLLPYIHLEDLITVNSDLTTTTALDVAITSENKVVAVQLMDTYPELIRLAKEDSYAEALKVSKYFDSSVWKRFNLTTEEINCLCYHDNQDTLLHLIAWSSDGKGFYLWLVEQGGDPTIKNSSGGTAQEIFDMVHSE